MSKLRLNDDADALISGRSPHPLLSFQRANLAALQLLGFLILSDAQLLHDPFGCYERFTTYLADALTRHPGPVPAFGNLHNLEQDYQVHRRAQRFIYATIVETLQVGTSMHYARRVQFGAGLHLLQVIRADNRQVTTRSLMALFSSLLSLRLKDSETFEAFSRRLDLLIQRLLNWRPPVVLPEQLLLFCALRALPVHPYGPVRHIILASPDVRFQSGMGMLRDVAGTGAQVIRDTLGSGETAPKSTAVLCANPCPVSPASSSPPPASSRARRTPAGRGRRVRKPRGPSKLCQSEGPCKHHGPHSFHATSECRDPTLSRSKRAQPRDDVPARALTATVQPIPSSSPAVEDTMYSPVFLTRISTSSRSRAPSRRARFDPRPSRRPHLSRNFRSSDRLAYDVSSVPMHRVDECIRAYTRPVRGVSIPPRASFSPRRHLRSRVPYGSNSSRRGRACRGRRRARARRHRRAHRAFCNRRNYDPADPFRTSAQRQPKLGHRHDRTNRRRAPRRATPRQTGCSRQPSHPRPRVSCNSFSAASQVHNLPLFLSVSLMVTCSSCGAREELPWPSPYAGGLKPTVSSASSCHEQSAAHCTRENRAHSSRSRRRRSRRAKQTGTQVPAPSRDVNLRAFVRGDRSKNSDPSLTHSPNADSHSLPEPHCRKSSCRDVQRSPIEPSGVPRSSSKTRSLNVGVDMGGTGAHAQYTHCSTPSDKVSGRDLGPDRGFVLENSSCRTANPAHDASASDSVRSLHTESLRRGTVEGGTGAHAQYTSRSVLSDKVLKRDSAPTKEPVRKHSTSHLSAPARSTPDATASAASPAAAPCDYPYPSGFRDYEYCSMIEEELREARHARRGFHKVRVPQPAPESTRASRARARHLVIPDDNLASSSYCLMTTASSSSTATSSVPAAPLSTVSPPSSSPSSVPAAPLSTVSPPSSSFSLSDSSLRALETASIDALLACPSPGESSLESHLRIGSTLAAREQLLELQGLTHFGLDDHDLSSEPHLMSPCLMATTSSTATPVAPAAPVSSVSSTTSDISSSVAPALPSESSVSTPTRVPRAPQSFSERLFDEYTYFAGFPGPDPPPFVPMCDFDINKIGIVRMQDWLVEQRKAHSVSRRNRAPDAPSTSEAYSSKPLPFAARRELDEYKYFCNFNRANIRPPPFVPSCDAPVNEPGARRTMQWLSLQRAAHVDDLKRRHDARTLDTAKHSATRCPASGPTSFASASTEPCIDLTDSADAVPSHPVRNSAQVKRRFRGHGWSKKGTKLSCRVVVLACLVLLSPTNLSQPRQPLFLPYLRRFRRNRLLRPRLLLSCLVRPHLSPCPHHLSRLCPVLPFRAQGCMNRPLVVARQYLPHLLARSTRARHPLLRLRITLLKVGPSRRCTMTSPCRLLPPRDFALPTRTRRACIPLSTTPRNFMLRCMVAPLSTAQVGIRVPSCRVMWVLRLRSPRCFLMSPSVLDRCATILLVSTIKAMPSCVANATYSRFATWTLNWDVPPLPPYLAVGSPTSVPLRPRGRPLLCRRRIRVLLPLRRTNRAY